MPDIIDDAQEREAQYRTEREVNELKDWAKAEGLPEFDDVALIKHAISTGANNLKSAYRDLMADDITKAAIRKHEEALKHSAKAKTVTSTAGSTKANNSFTDAELADMPDADFRDPAKFARILASFTKTT